MMDFFNKKAKKVIDNGEVIAYKGFLSARADELMKDISGYKKRVNKTRGYVDGIFS